MSAPNEPAATPPTPFPGHPFGGLVREDRFGNPPTCDAPLPAANGMRTPAADDDAGGFDFHLGVYARF